MNILGLSEVSKKDIDLVGGKAASLGELTTHGFSVPSGFVITTYAYKRFHNQKFSKSFKKELLSTFDALDADRVAVRSSAIVEDSPDASWAGQFESKLQVNKNNLFPAIKSCWNSVSSQRVYYYAKRQKIKSEQLSMAVVVQKMIDSKISGVLFTVNPVTKNNNELIIEACCGLGEALVQGEIIPDTYIINKDTLQVESKSTKNQQTNFSNAQLRDLATQAKKIEKYFQCPQDIEWAFSNNVFTILQSRPITSL